MSKYARLSIKTRYLSRTNLVTIDVDHAVVSPQHLLRVIPQTFIHFIADILPCILRDESRRRAETSINVRDRLALGYDSRPSPSRCLVNLEGKLLTQCYIISSIYGYRRYPRRGRRPRHPPRNPRPAGTYPSMGDREKCARDTTMA